MNKTIQKIRSFFRPPKEWRLSVFIATGAVVGFGIVAAHVGRATSYLSDDPKACMNCHVMAPQYATWERGSHARVTVCNDCHVPHDNPVRKYFFKAMDGTRHSFMFTFRMEPQVIRMHEAGSQVVQENCKRCHTQLVQNVKESLVSFASREHGGGKVCWECHRDVPHGRVSSLSSVPNARVPIPSSIVPTWMEKDIQH